ncbi:MAG: helix-turn-helix domain-containing protein [Clostridia bacterium]|nr:helix-turn-helix domain-containing protein [Clostridia bacterium]
MSFGKNLQYLRRLDQSMTQEVLAEKMNVSRQTVSKWEMDSAQPEMEKAIELCGIFNVTLDSLFREDLDSYDEHYGNLRVETVPAFRYIKHTVISTDPEGDAIDRIFSIAKGCGVEHPRVIGWDFPALSPEQINLYHMHGYEAAWVLPEGVTPPEDKHVFEQQAHRYAAIHISKPFEAPFAIIPKAYRTLMDYMRVNGLTHTKKDVIPCFETDGEDMDVYIACE